MVNLRFKRGESLSVHRALLQRNAKLALLANTNGHFGAKNPSLKHISRAAGHVLVQYLYADNYCTLKWMGPATGREEAIAKLKTGFEVYATAREYELDGLQELAKGHISILSKELDAFTIIAIVKETYPSTIGEDTWFPSYIKANIKAAFENSVTLMTSEVLPEDEPKDGVPITEVLLKGAIEVHREIAEALAAKAASFTPEPLTLVPVLPKAKKKKGTRIELELEPELEKGDSRLFPIR